MSKYADVLQKRLKEIDAELLVLRSKVTNEGKPFTAEERSKLGALATERTDCEASIALEVEEEARAAKPLNDAIKPEPETRGIEVGENLAATKPYKHFAEQLQEIRAAANTRAEMPIRLRKMVETRAASGMSEGIDADGGFAVQTDFSQGLLTRTYEEANLWGKTQNFTVSGNADSLKVLAVDETSRATGSRMGGVRVYRANEADTVTATKPKLREIRWDLHKMVGLCYMTEEQIQDSPLLEGLVQKSFAEEFAWKLDNEVMNGTGAGQLLGFMNSPALVTVSKETGQAAGTVVFNNISKMWSRMWAKSRGKSVWLINQDVEPSLDVMHVPVGTGGVPVYLPAGGVSGSPYSTLKGRPVIPIEQSSTLGTLGDITLVDLGEYMTISKGGLTSQMSIHVRFLYGENTYRFTLRNGGSPWWNSALTPANGSNTLSPFVALATRA